MERCECDLFTPLAAKSPTMGFRFSEPLARFLFRQVVNGVLMLSRAGLAHRDLKLENILLKGPGGGKAPIYIKIADFGTGTDITRTKTIHEIGTKCNNAIWDAIGEVTHTPNLSPNPSSNPYPWLEETYDAGKYDVFQLGCVLLQLLCVDGMQRKRVLFFL